MKAPADGWRRVSQSQTPAEEEAALAALRRSLARGAPFGDDTWAQRTAARLGLESSLRSLGRPRKSHREQPQAERARK